MQKIKEKIKVLLFKTMGIITLYNYLVGARWPQRISPDASGTSHAALQEFFKYPVFWRQSPSVWMVRKFSVSLYPVCMSRRVGSKSKFVVNV